MSQYRMLLGLRVVRGPDWNLVNEDGGEGGVGTIVSLQIGKNGRPLPEKTVLVLWDAGSAVVCRIGLGDFYDLRVFDSSSAGVLHTHVICDECDTLIGGMRWNCSDCYNYDLCTDCYTNDKHDKNHNFVRFDKPNNRTEGCFLEDRSTAAKVKARGIFPRATVRRGHHLTFDNDLGSMVGQVVEITAWEGRPRSAVLVQWSDALETTHRLGYEGIVDLEVVECADGPYYYIDHLPVVDDQPADMNQSADQAGSGLGIRDSDGNMHVVCGSALTFQMNALQKVPNLQAARDESNDLNECFQTFLSLFQAAQEAQEESVDNDKEGVVITEINEGADASIKAESILENAQIEEKDLSEMTEQEKIEQLFHASSDGDLKKVQYILSTNQHLVNEKPECHKAPLHVACYNGHASVVSFLIGNGADLEIKDLIGYAPLHYAAYGDKTGVCVVLMLTANACVNVIETKTRQTPLHLAIEEGNLSAVNALIHFGQCDVNNQNVSGNTPLHYAVSFAEEPILIEILQVPDLNPYLFNNTGLNALQLACLNNNIPATHALITKFPKLVDEANQDGFTPVHLAVLSNHCEVTKLLVHEGHCSIDLPNNNGLTPLALSVSLGHKEMMEVLIECGANVNTVDNDGDTPLHVAVMRYCMSQIGVDLGLLCLSENLSAKQNSDYSIVQFLVLRGARIDIKNDKGDTPLDVCVDAELTRTLKQLLEDSSSRSAPNQSLSDSNEALPNRLKYPTTSPSTDVPNNRAKPDGTRSEGFQSESIKDASAAGIVLVGGGLGALSTTSDEEARDDIDATNVTAVGDLLKTQGCSVKAEFSIESKPIIDRKILTEKAETNASVTDFKKNLSIQFEGLRQKLKDEKD